jgi:uncharacterized membrane protein YozB (DUF420 family)
MQISDLPAVNATLNSLSAILLMTGYVFIRQKNITAHKLCMISALGASALFLTSYLIYHYHVGSKPFGGQGAIRIVYFSILISHTILAVTIVPLALITLSRALKQRFDKHKRIARWTLPIWLYVSVTGVTVYWMLYQM